MPHRIKHAFPVDHPTAAGHFPGNPVIPGAVLLDVVLRVVFGGELGACEVRSAKFLHPVRPGDVMSIRWNEGDSIRFDCAVGERPVLTGSVRR